MVSLEARDLRAFDIGGSERDLFILRSWWNVMVKMLISNSSTFFVLGCPLVPVCQAISLL
jgi:hypothetical protein